MEFKRIRKPFKPGRLQTLPSPLHIQTELQSNFLNVDSDSHINSTSSSYIFAAQSEGRWETANILHLHYYWATLSANK